jgi:hypothetical protein
VRDEGANSNESDEGGGHGRERPPDQHAGSDAEGKGEGGITDRNDVPMIEEGEWTPLDAVDWARPPRQHQTENSRHRHARQSNESHFRQ